MAHDVTTPGGRVAVFVPAMPGIYGPIDAKSGHYRRYTSAVLRGTAAERRFEVDGSSTWSAWAWSRTG